MSSPEPARFRSAVTERPRYHNQNFWLDRAHASKINNGFRKWVERATVVTNGGSHPISPRNPDSWSWRPEGWRRLQTRLLLSSTNPSRSNSMAIFGSLKHLAEMTLLLAEKTANEETPFPCLRVHSTFVVDENFLSREQKAFLNFSETFCFRNKFCTPRERFWETLLVPRLRKGCLST